MTRTLVALLVALLSLTTPARAGVEIFATTEANWPVPGVINGGGLTALTFCFSMATQGTSNVAANIFANGVSSRGFVIGTRNASTTMAWYNGTGVAFATAEKAGTIKTTGEWQRFCWVYNAGLGATLSRRLFIDGVDQGVLTLSGTDPGQILNSATTEFCLGVNIAAAVCGGTASAFHAFISDVKAWRAALTTDQIARERFQYVPDPTDSLIMWMPLDDAPYFANRVPNDTTTEGASGSPQALTVTTGTVQAAPSDPNIGRP